jgi:glycosyltransferase involved in cell wall biosynthesis
MHKPKKLRIALVTTHPPGLGSLNEYAFHFVNSLRYKDEVSELILLVDELPEGQNYEAVTTAVPDSVPVGVIPCWQFNAMDTPWRILKAAKETKPDAILFNIQFASFGDGKVQAVLGLMTPAILKMAGFPTVVLLHNIMETVDLKSAGFAGNPIMEKLIRLFGTITTRFLLLADMVALTIPKYVETLEAKYKTDNVWLAPHGTFDDSIEMPSFDLPSGPMQIMTFGKFGTYKKVEPLIEAFEMLTSNGRPPLELVIAGSDSPNVPGYLENAKQQYSHVKNVRFTGYVAEEDVPRIFTEAAVTVFPYTSTTGSSGVLHQAGSYAKAAVLPHIGDFAEVIAEEGYAGEFFEPDDVPSLAQAIANVIDNPERRRELGTQNFLASKGLPIDEVVDWYLLHMQQLVEK